MKGPQLFHLAYRTEIDLEQLTMDDALNKCMSYLTCYNSNKRIHLMLPLKMAAIGFVLSSSKLFSVPLEYKIAPIQESIILESKSMGLEDFYKNFKYIEWMPNMFRSRRSCYLTEEGDSKPKTIPSTDDGTPMNPVNTADVWKRKLQLSVAISQVLAPHLQYETGRLI